MSEVPKEESLEETEKRLASKEKTNADSTKVSRAEHARAAQQALEEANKGPDPVDASDPRQGLPASVEVSEGNAPLQLSTEKKVDPNHQYVKYTGVGTVRTITQQDWKSLGLSGNHCQWSYMNGKRLPRSMFTDEQLQYLLRVDRRFELVTE